MPAEGTRNRNAPPADPSPGAGPRSGLRWTDLHPAELILTGLLLAAFGAKAVWFALRISPAIPPDEVTWFGISELFSHSLLPPADSPASYRFGLVTHVPTLYFWLMGRLLAANVFGLSDLVFLRLCNVVLVFATLHSGWHLMRRVGAGPAARLLFLVLATNTLMFTFLAGTVSYDNLANLLAAAALYYAVAFLRDHRPADLLSCIVCLGLGGLTKITYLPFAFLLVVGGLLYERRNLGRLPTACRQILGERRPAVLLLGLAALILVGMNVKLYGTNLLRYHRLQVPMDKVVGLEAALQYRIFARDYIVRQYKQDKITFAEAVRMSRLIEHEGDRNGALYLLQVARQEKEQRRRTKKPAERLDRFHYGIAWLELMTHRIVGIMGHQVLFKRDAELVPYYLAALLALVLGIRRCCAADLAGMLPLFLLVAGGYALILMQMVNYKSYHGSGAIELALQGRYVFPVLIPAYGLLAHALVGRGPRAWQWLALTGVAVLFVTGEFPWFIQHAGAAWFQPRP